jgi:hypothetical protein
MLATGPKGRGFKPGQIDEFLRAIKTRNTHSFGWEVKLEVPCRKILRHVKRSLEVFQVDRQNSHFFVHSLLAPDVSAGGTAREL